MKALKYIGRHKTFTDKIYGTGLRWERDVTVHRIEAKLANRFLRHKDSFAEVEGAAMLARTGDAPAAMVPQPAQSDDTQDGPGDVAPTIHEDNIVAEVLGLSAKGMKHGEIGKHLGLHHMQVSKIIRDHFSD
jgi:hypothetical protein